MPRGRKGTIPAEGKGRVDNVDVHNREVSMRASKQQALQKILSSEVEDSGDGTPIASAPRPSIRERKNNSSAGARAGAQQNNGIKQGSRAKKPLQSMPEDVATEAKFVEQGSRINSDEENELKYFAKEVKSVQGKSRSVHTKEKVQCKLQTGGEEEGKEPCRQASRSRGDSSMLVPGHSTTISPNQAPGSPLTTDCSSMPSKERSSLSAHMVSIQMPSKPELKKDQFLNVRCSARTRKIVHYNEQSPQNNSMAKAAVKRNASAAKLLPGAAKRAKEDSTSMKDEILELVSATVSCGKRGRRLQEPKLPQNLFDKKSAAAITHTKTRNNEDFESMQHKKGGNAKQVDSLASLNSLNFDKAKALSLQTALPESSKSLLAQTAETAPTPQMQEGMKPVSATKREDASSIRSIINAKKKSGRIAHNQSKETVSQKRSLIKKPQNQKMADGSGSSETLSMAAGKGVVHQHLLSSEISDENSMQAPKMVDDRKDKNTVRERKSRSKQRVLPDAAQMTEVDQLDALSLAVARGNKEETWTLPDAVQKTEVDKLDALSLAAARGKEEEKSKVLETPLVLVEGTSNAQSFDNADKKHKCKTQNRGRATVTRKRTLPETTQQSALPDLAQKTEVDQLDALSMAAPRGNEEKNWALPDAVQKTEVDKLDALSLKVARGKEEENSKVLEAPFVEGASNAQSFNDADKKHQCKTQNRGRATVTRKRTLPETTQRAKKLKVSESTSLDTLPMTESPKPLKEMIVEGAAAPAQTQEFKKVIEGVDSQDWNAVDITNYRSTVVRSSEKKKREEFKRKRAMKFDALPVGFGLGISCWSPPPWPSQCMEEGVVDQVEVEDSVMDFQAPLLSPMGEAEKQTRLQETAMLNDVKNTSLGLEDVNTLPATYHALPCSATKVQASTFSKSDAEGLPGSGMESAPKSCSNHQQEKGKVKKQAGRKTKTSKASLLVSPPAFDAIGSSNMLDKEESEPQVHVHIDDTDSKLRRSSRRRAATSETEKSARRRKQ